MISKFESIGEMFLEIDSKLDKPLKIFLIGGAALMHYGSKDSTKDIDIVLQAEEEFKELRDVLLKLGFLSKIAPITHQNFTLADWLSRGDFRLDLFNNVICGKLRLSQRIADRAKIFPKVGKLTVCVCSKEDIFLFKSITERDGDREDCITLVKQGINWDTIFNELNQQIGESGADEWITIVHDRLAELSQLGLTIPILKQVEALTEIYHEKLEKRSHESTQNEKSL